MKTIFVTVEDLIFYLKWGFNILTDSYRQSIKHLLDVFYYSEFDPMEEYFLSYFL